MWIRIGLAAGLAAMMFGIGTDVSAAPGRGPASRPTARPGVAAPLARPAVSKTIVVAKTTVAPKALVATKSPTLLPATVKAPGGKVVKTALYAPTFGVKTKGGFVAYKGLGHGHWSRRWFCGAHRCWLWYCPSACGWYYWAGGHGCYLPIRYLPVCAPTGVTEGEAPILPPGGEAVPTAGEGEVPNVPAKNDKPLDVPEPD